MHIRLSDEARSRLRWLLPTTFVAIAAVSLLIGIPLNVGFLQFVGIITGFFGFFLTLDAFGLVKDGWIGPQKPAEDRVKSAGRSAYRVHEGHRRHRA